MKGGLGLTGQSPCAACRSVWQTPQASIFTSTWPGSGLGTGTSSMVSGLPNSRTTAAFMVLFIRAILSLRQSRYSISAKRPERLDQNQALDHQGQKKRARKTLPAFQGCE